MSLSDLRALGRSGLLVSPLALGAMTFGNPRWGSTDEDSEAIFHAYVEAGGNFIDTANVYVKGRSEELLGQWFAADVRLRDRLVLATKSTFSMEPGNAHAGGNGRKHMYAAIDASLKRLRTEYVDLYWLHAWDQLTPVEEVLESLVGLVRAGKIRYYGLSDVPAWYATRMATLAEARGWPGPIALQLPYSLVERTIEREHVPAAHELCIGITPWGALGAGLLTGKYSRDSEGKPQTGGGRLDLNLPSFQMFTERNWQVLEVLQRVAGEAGLPLAQVALAWVLAQPGITSPIIGISKLRQLHEQIAALEAGLNPEQMKTLNEGSTPEGLGFYRFFSGQMQQGIFGGVQVQGWR